MSTPADMRELGGPLMQTHLPPYVSPSAASWEPAGCQLKALGLLSTSRGKLPQNKTWVNGDRDMVEASARNENVKTDT